MQPGMRKPCLGSIMAIGHGSGAQRTGRIGANGRKRITLADGRKRCKVDITDHTYRADLYVHKSARYVRSLLTILQSIRPSSSLTTNQKAEFIHAADAAHDDILGA